MGLTTTSYRCHQIMYWGLFLPLFAMISCTSQQEREYEQKRRTPLVTTVSGLVTSSAQHPGWDVVNERLVNFDVCLVDGARHSPILNHTFQIQGAQKGPITASTDGEGCLHWQEKLPFQYFAEPTFIALERVVSSGEFYDQTATARIGVNLWDALPGSAEGPAVVNLETTQPPRLTSLTTARTTQTDPVSMVSSRVQYAFNTDHQNIRSLQSLSLSFSPQAKMHTMGGQTLQVPLKKGELNIAFTLIRMDPSGQVVRHMAPLEQRSVAFDNNVITLNQLPLHLEHPFVESGTYYLVLRVAPHDGPQGLGGFNQVLHIGAYETLHAGGTAVLSEQLPLEISKLLESAPLESAPSETQSVADFDAELIEGRWGGPLAEDNLTRTIQVRFATRILSNMRTPLGNRRFQVSSMNAGVTPLTVTTTPHGELYWTDWIRHTYYNRAQALARTVTLEDLETHQKRIYTVELNPWSQDSGVFVRDQRKNVGFQLPSAAEVFARAGNPELRIEGQCLSRATSGPDHIPTVDERLHLVWNYPVSIEFSPKVFRFDDPQMGLNKQESLRRGYYLLTILVYQNLNETVGELISSSQKVVFFQGSTLKTDVVLPMPPQEAMVTRPVIAMQLSPVEESSLKREGLEYSAQDAQEARGLDLKTPIVVFPFEFVHGGCTSSPLSPNWKDGRLFKLSQALNQSGTSAHALHRSRELILKEESRAWQESISAREAQDWKEAAKNYNLKPYELRSEVDLKQTELQQIGSVSDVRSVLECLSQLSWGDADHYPKCLSDERIQEAVGHVCRQFSIDWREQLAREAAISVRDRNILLLTATRNCLLHPESFFKVDKKVHVYKLAPDKARYVGGFPQTSFSAATDFGIGYYPGSEYLYEVLTTYSLFGKGLVKAPVGGLKESVTALANRFRASLGLPPGVDFTHAVAAIKPAAKLSSKWQQMLWYFNYELGAQWNGIYSASHLTIENFKLELHIQRYRECFEVNGLQGSDVYQASGLTVAREAVRGQYFCFAPEEMPQDKPLRRIEPYYTVYNEPEETHLLNGYAAANRWFMQLRGDQDFGAFMIGVRNHLGPYQINLVPVEIGTLLRGTEAFIRGRISGEDSILSAGYPGREVYGPPPPPGLMERVWSYVRDRFTPFDHRGAIRFVDQIDPNTRK